MEKSVAGPIGEFDEAKSLLRTEPFYDATDRRTGGWFEPNEPSPKARLPLVVVTATFSEKRKRPNLCSGQPRIISIARPHQIWHRANHVALPN